MDAVLYLVLGVLGLVFLMQLIMRISTFTKKGKKITGVSGELGKRIMSGAKILVYFYSPT